MKVTNPARTGISRYFLAFAVTAVAALAACSDGGDDDKRGSPSTGASDDPLYAMLVQIYDTEDRTVYVRLTDSLDLDGFDLSGAREFAGVANFAAVGGKLLVSSGTEPSITKFDISNDFEWSEEDTVSFADYPFSDNANFYYQYILNDETAYMPFDVSKRLIWNPAEMTIDDTREESQVELEQDGLRAEIGGNRNGIHFDGPVLQAFFYTDTDYFEFAQDSVIAVYDERTHEEKELIRIACPALSMPSQDEDGYTYYATWSFQGTRALYGEGPKPCITRLKPDLSVDEDWTTDLLEWTDGRYHNNFRYIGGGRAIANVLHHEELDADLDGVFDPDILDLVEQSGDHWRLWLFDVEKKSGEPVEGIDVAISSGAQFAVLDGRTFVFLPYDDWGRTKIYELDEDGEAIERADTVGDVFKWIRVR